MCPKCCVACWPDCSAWAIQIPASLTPTAADRHARAQERGRAGHRHAAAMASLRTHRVALVCACPCQSGNSRALSQENARLAEQAASLAEQNNRLADEKLVASEQRQVRVHNGREAGPVGNALALMDGLGVRGKGLVPALSVRRPEPNAYVHCPLCTPAGSADRSVGDRRRATASGLLSAFRLHLRQVHCAAAAKPSPQSLSNAVHQQRPALAPVWRCRPTR